MSLLFWNMLDDVDTIAHACYGSYKVLLEEIIEEI
jgi:hypothetical protein